MNLTGIKLAIAAKRRKPVPYKNPEFGESRAIKKVGIILDSSDERFVKPFEKLFQDIGAKEVVIDFIFCMSPEKKEASKQIVNFKPGDIGWTGKITNRLIAAFIEEEVDLLIRFTKSRNPLAALLMGASNAALKVSREKGKPEDVDVVITTSIEEVDIFALELKKYLRILNKST